MHSDPPEGRGSKVLASDVKLGGLPNPLALFAPPWLKAFGLELELVNLVGGLLTMAKGVGDPKCNNIATQCLQYWLELSHSACGHECR